jgi:hypothetical protein
MSDVTPNMKPFGLCPCSAQCGLEGPFQSRQYKDGSHHVRRCPCKQCIGRRSKRTGGKAQRTARKLLAVPVTSSIRTGHEEFDGGLVRFECKSGAQVRPMITAFTKAEKQSEASRSIGDTRPTVIMALLRPEGKEAIMSVRIRSDDEMRAFAATLATQVGVMP